METRRIEIAHHLVIMIGRFKDEADWWCFLMDREYPLEGQEPIARDGPFRSSTEAMMHMPVMARRIASIVAEVGGTAVAGPVVTDRESMN